MANTLVFPGRGQTNEFKQQYSSHLNAKLDGIPSQATGSEVVLLKRLTELKSYQVLNYITANVCKNTLHCEYIKKSPIGTITSKP